MKIAKTLVAAAAVISLSSAANAGIFGTKLNQNEVQAVYAGQMGALSVNFQPTNFECATASLVFRNQHTGKKTRVSTYRYFKNPVQSLHLKAVQPGTYQLVSASCQLGNNTYRFKDIARAYGPITVRPGEVVYPGTFSPRRAGRHASYGLLNHTQQKARAMSQKYPGLAARFVSRPAAASVGPMAAAPRRSPYGTSFR